MLMRILRNVLLPSTRNSINIARHIVGQFEALEERLVPAISLDIHHPGTPGGFGFDYSGVVSADFNNDGIGDIAYPMTGFGPPAIKVQLGNDTSGWNAPIVTNANGVSTGMATGDFNHDGNADVVTANASGLSLYLGQGDGHFDIPRAYSPGGGYLLGVGDFNEDGNSDVAVFGGLSVAIYVGSGNGEFSADNSFAFGSFSEEISLGDFNGDGHIDLASAGIGVDSLFVTLGDGTGHFGEAIEIALGYAPIAVVAGDFDEDGIDDLAVSSISVAGPYGYHNFLLRGSANGEFEASSDVAWIGQIQTTADLNGDGHLDIVSSEETVLAVSEGDGSGSFAAPKQYWLPKEYYDFINVLVGEFNTDSRPDLVARPFDFQLHLISNVTGDGTPAIDGFRANDVSQSDAGDTTYQFDILLGSEIGIDPATIGVGNVSVRKANGASLTVSGVSFQPATGAGQWIATYTVDIPEGWKDADNGEYFVELLSNQIKDVAGTAIAAQPLGSFSVQVDTTLPEVVGFRAEDITRTVYWQRTYPITVTYSDSVSIDTSSLDINDIEVTAPDGTTLPIASISTSNYGYQDGRMIVSVNYIVDRPNGWNESGNGVYTVRLKDGQVKDGVGQSVAGRIIGTFQSLVDLTPPKVESSTFPPIGNADAGNQTYSFVVVYSDAGGIDLNTINESNFSAYSSGPLGSPIVFAAKKVQLDGTKKVEVTYSIYNADGWSSANNGSLYIRSRDASLVRDAFGNAVAGVVEKNLPIKIDVTPPTVAAFTAANVTELSNGPANYSFVIRYDDDVEMNDNSVRPQNVSVTRDDGHSLDVYLARAVLSGKSVYATYTVGLPAGWTRAENGTYTVRVLDNEVKDATGLAVAPTVAGSFKVNVGGKKPVVESISAPMVSQPIADSRYTFAVTYADDTAVDQLSIATSNIRVSNPHGGTLSVVGATIDPASTPVKTVVRYTVLLPHGGGGEDNGVYWIDLNPNQVRDESGLVADARSIGTFTVKVSLALPTVKNFNLPNVGQDNAGMSSYSFTVDYEDDVAIDASRIAPYNIVIVGPGGQTMMPTNATPNTSNNSKTISVVYSLSIPGGWKDANSGAYTVKLLGGSVSDTAGNWALGKTLGSFTVDLTPPAVKSVSMPAVTPASMGQTAYSFTVAYSDNLLVNVGSVGVGNVSVTGPNGQALTVLSATPNAASNGSSRNVVYTVAVPGGWSEANAGTYTVKLNGGQVKDTAGNAVEAKTLGTFKVSMDATPPTVSRFSLPNVTQANAGQTTYSFSVSYADNLLLSIASISPSNVSVTGPGGRSLTVVSATPNANSNGSARNVTYTVAVPDGWSEADVGTYSVRVLGGQVKDTAGNAVAAKTIGTFTVDITPPAIKTAVAKNVTGANAGQATYSFTVSFTDNLLLNIASVGVGNVSVTGPNGTKLTVTSATPNAASNGSSRTVTYTVAVPGGWKEANNGAYTIKLLANQIKDTAGNTIVAQTITAFSVLIPPVAAAI